MIKCCGRQRVKWDCQIYSEEMAFGKNVKIAISQQFEIFNIFIFQILVSVFQRIFNSWRWNWSQMCTYGPYYSPLAITPFRPNGPFTYEMPHISNILIYFSQYIGHVDIHRRYIPFDLPSLIFRPRTHQPMIHSLKYYFSELWLHPRKEDSNPPMWENVLLSINETTISISLLQHCE